MMDSTRIYDIVLLGPTGYTGRLCAEHIVQHLPTNLKWAIAGRSLPKVDGIAKELKTLNPDRAEPDTLEVQLRPDELNTLAQKTRLIINCVGPYLLYSTPVVEACAANGTHYVDATGETPWIRRLIEKYHETAKTNGAIIIPSVGIESAPADILAWTVVKRVREELSCHTKEVTGAIEEMKSSGASGGTLTTILTAIETIPAAELTTAMQPFSLAASPPPKVPRESIMEKVLGVRTVRDMGTLTTSPSGMADISIVHRSSSLMPEFYGPRFYFRQFLHVRNTLVGVAFHYLFLTGLALLLLPPVRWIVKKLIYAPGQGPTRENSKNDYVEYRAIATADQNTPTPQRVLGKLKIQGSMYVVTGLLLAEAAMVILENEDKVRKVSRGGLVTPATLGQEFVDRLETVGCKFDTQVLKN